MFDEAADVKPSPAEGEGVDGAVTPLRVRPREGGHAREKVPEVPPAAMEPPAPE